MWTDAHSHLSDKRLENRLDNLLNYSKLCGISRWVQGGISPQDWEKQVGLKKQYPGQILTSFGMHPWWVSENTEETLDSALSLLKNKLAQADAFGEIGLDFGKRFTDPQVQLRQRKYFKLQLELLKTTQKPLVLHVVDAHQEVLAELKKHSLSKGIVHSFSGSVEEAKVYIDLGLTISISGVITRPGYKKLKQAAKALPQDKIVIETDCPDQRPSGVEGELNLPENLLLIAEEVARLRGETKEEVLNYSTKNCERIFLK